MKVSSALLVASCLVLLPGCVPSPHQAGPLPSGVIQRGSLANRKLISDAGTGAMAMLAAKGHRPQRGALSADAYVVRMPAGSPGSRRWTERWYFHVDGGRVPVTIDFRENGFGAADYVIRN